MIEIQDNPNVLDTVQIQQILPHRYPMLLVDRVLDCKAGEYAIGRKNVSINEDFFQGHFPGNPVMPGALILEALAQTGAIALLSLPEFKGKTAYFGGVRKAKFRQMVRPGDVLRLEVELDKLRSNVGLGKAKAYVEDQLACSADLTFAIQ
ncbi:3-hydroxyacyl-ACP dehydratase FabZ [Bombilactobacillus thymidiniphilus]|uniref:3-hydroxyacyl-[acyl-carrier-protein] dehydratase FabZ n=1 Tax=Bombilactobacillus thymidiniphilus TaxID=2923363 RepID=A0ABY4PEU9_9LACO|nr:3-hydroxyacyl-ACP dehydratase FabZ [Bombilactobacillus thymidiniphilus]UQS84224.1 3-hydroxyacyl-ACP dehydratase FabZ [Bombilactobacillus thymidiniphilus]